MSDQHCPRCGFVRFDRSPLEPPPERCPRCAARGHTEPLRPSNGRSATARGDALRPARGHTAAAAAFDPSKALR